MSAAICHVPSTNHQPLQVVRIIDRLNIGGPTKHVVWLTAELSQAFAVDLVTGTVQEGEGDMHYFAQAAGVEPFVIPEMSRELSLRDVVVVVKLLRHLWRLKPQIVHTHKAKAGAAGRIAVLLYKWLTPSALWLRPRPCHVVHTYHGHVLHSYFGTVKTWLFRTIERLLARVGTDRIIVLSEQQRGEIAEDFRVGRSEQFRVVPLGLDLDKASVCRGRLRQELGVADTTLLVGIVGRLCEVKHHAMLLKAAARLVGPASGSDMQVRFVVIGDGHLRHELESLARRLGIAPWVTFTGFRHDVMSLYADLDVVVLTSLSEGTPLTLIEAMCCGRAVVATEVGGVVDIMGGRRASADGFSVWDHGVTAPSRDAAAFARALRYVLGRPALRREMGARGGAFVRTHLSKERLVRDIEDLYHDMLGLQAEDCVDSPVDFSQALLLQRNDE